MINKLKNLFSKKTESKVKKSKLNALMHSMVRDCIRKEEAPYLFPKKFRKKYSSEYFAGMSSLYSIHKKMPPEKREAELKKICRMLYLVMKYAPTKNNRTINFEKK